MQLSPGISYDFDKEIRVDLTEPGALYDYLVEYAAPEGVQEDEL